ncbi:MAG: nuclear transport factor 2 family protein [Acidimicrobiia bacterium]|nr:nuclear transport factor 2 family protein [Acidimicrobiia bacterium]MBT8192474.1 nuclear transport factor 2 family protein [Acidimicrobiia bacterium]NNL14505.1 nuclear transport factor 2 family protein [Acidimicrobiia bacterium]NNL97905.1 nuclear transport factor 2 family protein [Acidimicrobiia bacterium]
MTTTTTPPRTIATDERGREPGTNRWLIAAVVALLAAVAGLGIWLAAEISSDGDVATPAVVEGWADAFLAGDPEAVASLFTETGVYEERGPTHVFEGRSAIRQQLVEAFEYGDATEMTPLAVVVGDGLLAGRDVIAVEWRMSGMSAPGSRNPTDKTPFSVQTLTLFEMSNDLIARSVFYASWYELFN